VVGIHQLDLDRCVFNFQGGWVPGFDGIVSCLAAASNSFRHPSRDTLVTPLHRDQNDCKMTTSYGEDEDNFVDSSDGICGK
jgi:hypothetical protein